MAGERSIGPARHGAEDFPQELLRDRDATIAVCVPVLNEAETIGGIVDVLATMRAEKLIDEVIVLDGTSNDGSARIAEAAGATVYDQTVVLSEFGPALGKGDAMWRALAVVQSEIVAYFDGDLSGFARDYVIGLAGVLLAHPEVAFAKAAFDRPLRLPGSSGDDEGGRVTEAMAKPMLKMFYPELCAFRQPLSGQIAARRELLSSIPMSTGYGVDVGILIDVYRAVGLEAMAEVDIGVLHNAHQDLVSLEPMAFQVALAITRRMRAEGRLTGEEGTVYMLDDVLDAEGWLDLDIVDRPAMASLRRFA